jgi:hypothetical protein
MKRPYQPGEGLACMRRSGRRLPRTKHGAAEPSRDPFQVTYQEAHGCSRENARIAGVGWPGEIIGSAHRGGPALSSIVDGALVAATLWSARQAGSGFWACCSPIRVQLGRSALNPVFTASLLLAALALVGVFIEIPVISNYAFWVLMAAYIMLAGRR